MAARMPPEALDRIVERLERTAAELRTGDLDPERAASWSTSAPGWPPRRARSWTARCARPTPAASSRSPVSYPEHLRTRVEDYLEQLRFSQEAATGGLEEAMRYSLLAGGKRIRRSWRSPPPRHSTKIRPTCCRWPPRWS